MSGALTAGNENWRLRPLRLARDVCARGGGRGRGWGLAQSVRGESPPTLFSEESEERAEGPDRTRHVLPTRHWDR